MTRISARVDITAVALEPIHHGAGTSGNTQILRTQDIILPDGRAARVPFISGNSLKHMVREAGANFALEAMAIADGSLTKPVTDLLFSGGALTKAGSNINLERGRQIEKLFPLLGLLGYSAGNTMTQGKLRVNNLHLICEENAWRVPVRLSEHKALTARAGRLRGEEFGTRHESSRRPRVAKMLTTGERKRLEDQTQQEGKGDTAQMIYEYQVLNPGSHFWGTMHLDDVTEMELAAFKSAMSAACEGAAPDGGLLFRVGAKSSIGCGLVSMQFSGQVRDPVQAPGYTNATALVTIDQPSDIKAYAEHLHQHSEEIVTLLTEAMA